MPTPSASRSRRTKSKSKSKSKSFRNLSASQKRAASKTRKLERVSFAKTPAQLKRFWEQIRRARIDAYIRYVRNAKYLLILDSVSSKRMMYGLLLSEQSLFSDFSRQFGSYRKFQSILQLLNQQQQKMMETQIRNETERIRQAAIGELDKFQSKMEVEKSGFTEYISQLETTLTHNKLTLQKQQQTHERELLVQTSAVETSYKRQLLELQSQFHSQVASLQSQLQHMTDVKREETRTRQTIQVLEERGSILEQHLKQRDHLIDALTRENDEFRHALGELNVKLKGIYAYEVASGAANSIKNVFMPWFDNVKLNLSVFSELSGLLGKSVWEAMKKQGQDADANIQAQREAYRQAKEQLAAQMAELQRALELQAEELRIKMERDEQERMEKEEMAGRRRAEAEAEAEARAKMEAEAQRKREEEEGKPKTSSSTEPNYRKMADERKARENAVKIDAVSKQLNAKSTTLGKCKATMLSIPAFPVCKDPVFRTYYKKDQRNCHPDKVKHETEDCKQFAELKSKHLSHANSVWNDLPECN